MTDPAAEKPEARGKHIAPRVVGHDLRFVVNSESGEKSCEDLRIGQRMTAVAAGLLACEIFLDAGEEGAWNVRLLVRESPERKIGERVTAIDNGQSG